MMREKRSLSSRKLLAPSVRLELIREGGVSLEKRLGCMRVISQYFWQ